MNWDKYYDRHTTIEQLLSNLYGQKKFLAEIINSAPKKILEVGTGSGAMAIFLAWLGFDVISVDINPKVIDRAKVLAKKSNASVKFQVADGFKLPFADNSFDVVFHQGLLEHLPDNDIYRMLDEQLRVAPKVILSVPNYNYPRRDFGNERLMTKGQWEKILNRYHIVKSINYSSKIFPKFYLPKALIQYMAVIKAR